MTVLKPEDNFAAEGQVAPEHQPTLIATSSEPFAQLGSLELSGPLENSAPVEAPRFLYRIPVQPTAVPDPVSSVSPAVAQLDQSNSQPNPNLELQPKSQTEPQADLGTRAASAVIPLLEERLVVNWRKRKIGEVVVRKEIETHIVEVQVRREKLIVEQVSPEYQQLAVVNLGQVQGDELDVAETALPSLMEARFTSAQAAIEFLQALVAESDTEELQTVQINVVNKSKRRN